MISAGLRGGMTARAGSGGRVVRAVIGMASISAVLNILMLGGSFFMLLVYDEVLPSRSVATLIGLLAMITIAYIFQALLDLVRMRAMVHLSAIVDEALSDRVFRIVVRHELRFGPLADGVQPVRDLDQVRAFLAGSGPLVLLDLPWVVLFLAVLFLFHVALGLLTIAGVAVLVLLTLATDRLTRAQSTRVSGLAASRFALADTARRNAEALHALGMAGRATAAWNRLSGDLRAANSRAALLTGRMSSASRTFRMLLQSLVLATGAALVISGRASGGVIIAGSILSSRALAPVDHSIAHWKGFVAARQAWSRLSALLNRAAPDAPLMALPAPCRRVEVDRLSAAPPGTRTPAFVDVRFALEAGDILGIVGPSGSGKTSLLRAIVGVWAPLRGTVRLDGATLDQWSSDALGAHLGYLPQDVELLDGTIAQNIARFTVDADEAAILAAAHAAGVHDLIVRLPHGYETHLGRDGSSLSAGQRQRIGLARALYGDPFLIVLDEPNSNLDQAGELALRTAIVAAARRGAIVILVAHRRSALRDAGRLLYLEEGRQRLFGARDDVLATLAARAPSTTRTTIGAVATAQHRADPDTPRRHDEHHHA